MRVIISVGGKWHMDKLAVQCERYGLLEKFITSYPKFSIDKQVPREKIKTFLWHQIGAQLVRRLSLNEDIGEKLKILFDKKVSKYLNGENMDIFVGFSGFCCGSIEVAKSKNAIAIIDRGSSHISLHCRLLEEEYNAQQGDHVKDVERLFAALQFIAQEANE